MVGTKGGFTFLSIRALQSVSWVTKYKTTRLFFCFNHLSFIKKKFELLHLPGKMGASLHLLHLSHQLPGAAQDFFSTASKQNKEITMIAIKHSSLTETLTTFQRLGFVLF